MKWERDTDTLGAHYTATITAGIANRSAAVLIAWKDGDAWQWEVWLDTMITCNRAPTLKAAKAAAEAEARRIFKQLGDV